MANAVSLTIALLRLLELFLVLHESSGLSIENISVEDIEKIEIAEKSVHETKVNEAAAAFLERVKAVFEEHENFFSSAIDLRSIHLDHVLMILIFQGPENGFFGRRHQITALNIVNSQNYNQLVNEFVDQATNLVNLRQESTY